MCPAPHDARLATAERESRVPGDLKLTRPELKAVWLVCAVQFINMLDSMMVLPLGPEFSRALNVPPSQIGLIGGAFVLAACVSGLIGSLVLDRFDRRRALVVCMVGLLAGTALSGFSATTKVKRCSAWVTFTRWR